MTRGILPAVSLACCAWLAACAGGVALSDSTPGAIRAGRISAPAAAQSIAAGKSTQADVAAALGQAAVIRFDSGHQVWVYRWSGADRTTRASTELVVLFEPSGIVKKTRIRPGYAAEPR